MRAAIYYTPAPGSLLARLGADWLGRDAFTGLTTRDAGPFDEYLAESRRYGIHATLRAPFRLREGRDLAAVEARLARFCADRAGPTIGRLVVVEAGRNYELGPAEPEPGIAALEADVLDAFEPFRAPLANEEVARRRPELLSERERALLERWGYPYVLDAFRFHISLAWPMPDGAPDLRPAIEAHFAPVLGRPLPLDGLGLFVEPEPGVPFHVRSFHPFGPAAAPEPSPGANP